jgi:hypothetical protein
MIGIISCGQDISKENRVSSLIKPNFTYNYDLFKCTLNENYSLIGLETFFSKNITKYMSFAQKENLKVSMLFPDKNNSDVENFAISITSKKNYAGLENFIDILKKDGLLDITSCDFSINMNNAFDILTNNNHEFNNNQYINIEMLICKYKPDYNYGTFKVSIDRFLQNVKKIKTNYAISYIEDKDNSNQFTWINKFFNNDYQDKLVDNWLNNGEASDIQKEFIENASCISSENFQLYQLI